MVNASTEQWRVVLGDTQFIHVYTPNYTDEIVCIGTNCYCVVDDNSTIIESKHIENEISSSRLVELPTGGYNILLGTFSQHIYIYNKSKLIWAAKCHFTPILKPFKWKISQAFWCCCLRQGHWRYAIWERMCQLEKLRQQVLKKI
jgi:hypothetical protein